MKILVLNCGSSSLKYQVLDMANEEVLGKGIVERIGIEGSIITHQKEGCDKVKKQIEMKDHSEAINQVIAMLTDKEVGVVADMNEITAVGHRIVHAGEKYSESVLVTEEVFKDLEDCIPLAPLHNPANLLGIKACQKIMPNAPMVAVFDTAFHQTMKPEAFMYALPYKYYEKYGIRKYGFHGTSHQYVAKQASEFVGKDIKDLKIITCHLGNGASVAAIKGGVCIDTSMGFTPLEGLAMGTRSGSIDPAIVTFIQDSEGVDTAGVNKILNSESGILGLSEMSSDFRDIEDAVAEGNERAILTQRVFAHKVKGYIGSYMAQMDGVDIIVFTAGVGENDTGIRALVCEGMDNLGIGIDPEKNNVRGKARDLSKDGMKVKVLLIPTNEELVIARDTKNIINK